MSFLGCHHTAGAKEAIGIVSKERFPHGPMFGKLHSRDSKEKIACSLEEFYQTHSVRDLSGKNNPMFGKHLSLEARRKIVKALTGKHPSEKTLRKRSESMKRICSDPVRRNRMSKVMENKWKDPEYAKKVFAHRSPNEKELECLGVIDSVVPKDFKFVGNGQVTFGGKCPDFMNVNGKKLLIEFNSEYWHKGENTRTRARHFAKYGWKTLFIWQRELKNPERLRSKISKFVSHVG